MDRAVSDFLGFYQHHVWGFVLPLVAAAIALPTVRYLAGADLTEEVWLLVAYGVIGSAGRSPLCEKAIRRSSEVIPIASVWVNNVAIRCSLVSVPS